MCRPKPTSCSWNEVRAHTTKESCWVGIRGKAYDVTPFLANHPGGEDMLLLAGGRDATYLFQSYHPFTNKPEQFLEKFFICDIVDNKSENFPRVDYEAPASQAKFYGVLSQRIKQYFDENKIDHKFSIEAVVRIIGIVFMLIFSFIMSLTATTLSSKLGWAALHGLFQALESLQHMHDASHCAITHSPWVWKLLGASWDFTTGASFYVWQHTHTVGHHTYTNVRGLDPDIGNEDRTQPELRRVSPNQKYFNYYRLQHLYSFFLYPLLTFKYRFEDTVMQFTKTSGPHHTNVIPVALFYWALGKASFIFFRFVVPTVFVHLSISETLMIFAVAELVTGAWLTFNFQVSHIAEHIAHFEAADKVVKMDWAVSQVVAAQNYALGNSFWTFMCGALNYQVEHHLFPSVHQTHYPKIAPIVQKTCKEFGVPYNNIPSIVSAFFTHFSYVKNMGRKGWAPKEPRPAR